MILLLGKSGYIGSEFNSQLFLSGAQYKSLSRSERDYTNPAVLVNLLSWVKPTLVINAAAYVAVPSVDNNDDHKEETLLANLVFPSVLTAMCQQFGVPLMHISTGCLFRAGGGGLNPTEASKPEIEFDKGAGYYTGSKALAERVVMNYDKAYILRIRLPFDEKDHPRNLLTKLLLFDRVWDVEESLTHRGDFVRAALSMFEKKVPYGIYNMTNPGGVRYRDVVEKMCQRMMRERAQFIPPPMNPRTMKSTCVLDCSKLAATGVSMRPGWVAVQSSIENWQAARPELRPE